ncbi:YoaK family protein [Micromonospora costi]|uniref:YoaK family protein n=1 Tax=Micromonospora costi TaxID=1530042 RepID=UPI00131A0A8C|nr:YoaK family protein [Micromonospora costi]
MARTQPDVRFRTPTAVPEALLRRRHALVVVLTFLTGSADAVGFLSLGGAFSSVMTGNMVLLGLSAGREDAELAVTSGCAILSFVVGVLAGARVAGVARPGDPVWPRPVTRALLLELAVFLVFLVVWEVNLPDHSDNVDLALLLLSAAALGVQSSAVQRFGVPGLSSTYLTGTLTSLIGGVAARSPWHTLRPRIQILAALMTGAAVGALVAVHLPVWAPVLLLVPLVTVVAVSARMPQHPTVEAPDAP